MGRSMIGSLLKFDCDKRKLFCPNAPLYPPFDQQVGLCISHSTNARGEEHVRVQWLKPVHHFGRPATVSDFPLSNFIGVGRADGKK